jgi:hypothetical protein
MFSDAGWPLDISNTAQERNLASICALLPIEIKDGTYNMTLGLMEVVGWETCTKLLRSIYKFLMSSRMQEMTEP